MIEEASSNSAQASRHVFDLAIICGYGQMPVEIADSAIESGHHPLMIGIENEADDAIRRFPHEILAWGQIGKLFRLLKTHGIEEVVFAGGIRKRPEILRLKLDLTAILSLPQVLTFMLGGDNTVLSGTIKLFEKRGIRVVGLHTIAPKLLARAGLIAGKNPGKKDLRSMRLGFAACKALGAFDIGQASVAEAGRVVALEGVEGTDAMLERIVEMRRIGRMPAEGKNGVLVKTLKPGQDIRADLPAIGPATVTGVIAAGLRGIAVEADRSVILERNRTLETARRGGIFIYGLTSSEAEQDG